MNFHVGDGRRDGPITTACDNVIAWRLGEACNKASSARAGDLIDRGLALLKELNATGFQVVVPREQAQDAIAKAEGLNIETGDQQ